MARLTTRVKVAASKAVVSKVEASKAEVSKAEVSKVEASKVEAKMVAVNKVAKSIEIMGTGDFVTPIEANSIVKEFTNIAALKHLIVLLLQCFQGEFCGDS